MFFRNFLLALFWACSLCVQAQSAESEPVRNDVEIQALAPGVATHTSFMHFSTGWGWVPANGLLIKTNDGLVLIDTPWNVEQTRFLLRYARKVFKQRVKYAIVTHSHYDRVGGIKWLHKKGVRTFSTKQTATLAVKEGYESPQVTFEGDTVLTFGNVKLEVFYPGAGHAPDNIVVWLPASKVLFGGCFIKSATATDLGNIADADLASWKVALEKVYMRYPEAIRVVPGHGPHAGLDLIKHTSNLIYRHEQK